MFFKNRGDQYYFAKSNRYHTDYRDDSLVSDKEIVYFYWFAGIDWILTQWSQADIGNVGFGCLAGF